MAKLIHLAIILDLSVITHAEQVAAICKCVFSPALVKTYFNTSWDFVLLLILQDEEGLKLLWKVEELKLEMNNNVNKVLIMGLKEKRF